MGFDRRSLDTNFFHISKHSPLAVGIKELHKNPYGLSIQAILLWLKFRLAEKITYALMTQLCTAWHELFNFFRRFNLENLLSSIQRMSKSKQEIDSRQNPLKTPCFEFVSAKQSLKSLHCVATQMSIYNNNYSKGTIGDNNNPQNRQRLEARKVGKELCCKHNHQLVRLTHQLNTPMWRRSTCVYVWSPSGRIAGAATWLRTQDGGVSDLARFHIPPFTVSPHVFKRLHGDSGLQASLLWQADVMR